MTKVKPSRWFYLIPVGIAVGGIVIFIVIIAILFTSFSTFQEFKAGNKIHLETTEDNSGYTIFIDSDIQDIDFEYGENNWLLLHFEYYNEVYDLRICVYEVSDTEATVPVTPISNYEYIQNDYLAIATVEFEKPGKYVLDTAVTSTGFSQKVSMGLNEEPLEYFALFTIAMLLLTILPYPLLVAFSVSIALIYTKRKKCMRMLEAEHFNRLMQKQ